MQKYWALDLTFLKSKGRTTCDAGLFMAHPKHKEFVIYKVDQYVKSKVIGKNLDCDIYEESGQPFQYLEMKRRFIIPSEVTITREYFLRHVCCNNTLLEETKTKSVVKYVVDERNMFLKPSIIIYYNHDSTQPFISSHSDCFEVEINRRTVITYDPSRNEYKYYNVDDCGAENCDLQGVKAKQKIEDELFEYELQEFKVTPVENIETVFQTV